MPGFEPRQSTSPLINYITGSSWTNPESVPFSVKCGKIVYYVTSGSRRLIGGLHSINKRFYSWRSKWIIRTTGPSALPGSGDSPAPGRKPCTKLGDGSFSPASAQTSPVPLDSSLSTPFSRGASLLCCQSLAYCSRAVPWESLLRQESPQNSSLPELSSIVWSGTIW